MSQSLIEIQGVSKHFPGVKALDDVTLDITAGETHILLGENGAGKSTLVKILSGIYKPDGGSVKLNNALYAPESPRDAMQAGIRLIHQEFNLLDYLSVAENIYFDRLPQKFGLVNYQVLNQQAQALLDEVGLDISASTMVDTLSVAQKQMVEIAKALSSDNKLIIMDEPTATLTNQEISRLFSIIHTLKTKGVTIIYISHRLQEIYEIGDRFTVLRNGQKVSTQNLKGVEVDEIVKLMVGHDLTESYPTRTPAARTKELFRAEALQPAGATHEVSFSVAEGEIVGIAGLVGAGRSEILRAIFGADKKRQGNLFMRNNLIDVKTPKDAVKHGISLVTENRKEEGLLLDMPCYVNISLANLAAIARNGLMQFTSERSAAEDFVKELAIRTPSVDQKVRNLSGGNQQKVVLAKWLFCQAQLLMVDEPTRGIDVGARYEIYQLLHQLADEGKGVIVVSSDLPELMGICDRILVISKGKLTGEVMREDFDQEKILNLAFQEYAQQRKVSA